MRLAWLISWVDFSSETNPVSNPKYNWLLTSPHDARAIYRKRANSFSLCLSNPSAIFEVIESDALSIWSRKKKSLQSLISSNRALLNLRASCQTINSSNFKTFLFIFISYLSPTKLTKNVIEFILTTTVKFRIKITTSATSATSATSVTSVTFVTSVTSSTSNS